jgi:hypothetical protein
VREPTHPSDPAPGWLPREGGKGEQSGNKQNALIRGIHGPASVR